MAEHRIEEAHKRLEAFVERIRENWQCMYEESWPAIQALAALSEQLEEAQPKTVEEWREAYEGLERKYQRLYEAAEHVWSVAFPPSACKPTQERENGTYRKIVATSALDKLREELLRD